MPTNELSPQVEETDTGYALTWTDRPMSLALTDLEGSNGRLTAWAVFDIGGPIPFGRISLSNPIALSNCWPVEDDQKPEWLSRCRWALESLHQYRNEKTGGYVDFMEFAPEEQPPFLLDPYIRDGQHTVIFGDGDNGKSILALWWGVQVARTKGPVLYLDYETDANTIGERLNWIMNGLWETTPPISYLAGIQPVSTSLTAIKRYTSEIKPVLIIVDSGAMASGKPQEDEAVLSYFSAMRELGRSTLTILHVAKNANGGEPYGSVYWRNMSRLALKIDGQRQDDGIIVGISDTKSNNASRLPPRALQFRWDSDGETIKATSTDPVAVDAIHNRRTLKDQVWDILTQPMTVKEISTDIGVPEVSIREVLNRRNHKDIFARNGNGLWARLA